MIKIKKDLFISVIRICLKLLEEEQKYKALSIKKKVLVFFEVVKDRTKGWDTANSA